MDGGAPYVVKPEKLDRFIGYQERSLALQAQMLEDLGKLETRGMDAASTAGEPTVSLIRKHAEAQALLRLLVQQPQQLQLLKHKQHNRRLKLLRHKLLHQLVAVIRTFLQQFKES